MSTFSSAQPWQAASTKYIVEQHDQLPPLPRTGGSRGNFSRCSCRGHMHGQPIAEAHAYGIAKPLSLQSRRWARQFHLPRVPEHVQPILCIYSWAGRVDSGCCGAGFKGIREPSFLAQRYFLNEHDMLGIALSLFPALLPSSGIASKPCMANSNTVSCNCIRSRNSSHQL